jgi:hypothetical protein
MASQFRIEPAFFPTDVAEFDKDIVMAQYVKLLRSDGVLWPYTISLQSLGLILIRCSDYTIEMDISE